MAADHFEMQLARLFEDPGLRDEYLGFIKQLWSQLSSGINYPTVIGLTGGQGTGKTTLASLLVLWARKQGIAATSVSLDDYYLSQQQRAVLAEKIHPLLALRGMPGSHNIQQAIIDAKAVLCSNAVALPVFDKALDQPVVARTPMQVKLLIVEGWCLGLTPQSPEQLLPAINQLELSEDQNLRWRTFVNEQLAGLYQQYWQLFSQLIWLKAPDWSAICGWRALQEQQLWFNRSRGMSTFELARFMQSFQRLTEHSFSVLPRRSDIVVELDQHHRPRLI
ncbi:MAG: kinase [Rheinheimera sp.]